MDSLRPDTIILNWLLTLPFFAAACAAIFPRLSFPGHSEAELETLRRGPFLLGSLASLMGVGLAASLLPAALGASPLTVDYWWTKDLYHLRFQADALSTPLLIAVFGIGGLIHMYLAGLPLARQSNYQGALLLGAQGSAVAACTSADVIVLFFFLELTLVFLWILVRPGEAWAANGMMAAGHVGGLVFLGGAMLMWQRGGDSSIAALPLLLVSSQPGVLQTIAALVLLGLLPKIVAIPAHAWLPDVVAGSPRLALAPALLLPVVGGAALLRLLPGTMVLQIVPGVAAVALLLGIASLWWGAIRAWMAETVGHLAAWLMVAQTGVLLMAVGGAASTRATTESAAAALQLLVGPGAAAAVWLAAGAMRGRFGTDRITDVKGIWSAAPLEAAALLLGGLSLAGVPPLPGYYVQKQLVSGLLQSGHVWFVVVLAAGDVLVAIAVLDALRRLAARNQGAGEARWTSSWLSAGLLLSVLAVVAGAVWAGPLVGWSRTVMQTLFSLSRGTFTG